MSAKIIRIATRGPVSRIAEKSPLVIAVPVNLVIPADLADKLHVVAGWHSMSWNDYALALLRHQAELGWP